MEDGLNLAKLIKHGLGASKLYVYGRSLGGHVAKALAYESDFLIIDRSFSSISMVPRLVMGHACVQFVYDLLIENF